MKTISSFWKRLADPDFKGIPDTVSASYLPSLDGLRAISIVIVLLAHLTEGAINGKAGVNIFFVISGFLITSLLLKEKVRNGHVSLKHFYVRRTLRIFPVAYLYLFALIFLNVAFQLHIHRNSFLVAFFYLQNFSFFKDYTWFTGHFWSLAIEEQFYLIFPFILVFNYKLYLRLVLILIAIVPFINLLCYHGPAKTEPAYVVLQLLADAFGYGTTSILWGSLLSILLFKNLIPLGRVEKYRWMMLPLLALMLLFNSPLLDRLPGNETAALILFAPGICGVVLLGLIPGPSFGFTFLNNRIMRTLGKLSYSIYIWQQPFTYEQPWAHAIPYGNTIWLNLLLLGITACLSYYGFEKPFLKLKDVMTRRYSKPEGGAVMAL